MHPDQPIVETASAVDHDGVTGVLVDEQEEVVTDHLHLRHRLFHRHGNGLVALLAHDDRPLLPHRVLIEIVLEFRHLGRGGLEIVEPGGARSPVSVGVGGSTGSYGSGVGVGIGFDLSPRPSEQIETTLAVVIRDRETRKSLWEGRASFTVTATSPLSNTQLGAPKLAEALFRGFPGESGETILVE